MLVFLIMGFITLGLWDYYTVLRQEQKKTYLVYFSLLGLGFVLNLLLMLDRAPVSPVILIEKIVKSFV